MRLKPAVFHTEAMARKAEQVAIRNGAKKVFVFYSTALKRWVVIVHITEH